MTIFIGIDPGLDGACASVGGIKGQVIFDTPTLTVVSKSGKRREYDVAQMVEWLEAYAFGDETLALIENVHSMPGQGVRSMFTMGYGVGVWVGILAALHIPFERVTPQRWKKAMLDGQGKDKDASRFKAQAMFPRAELHLKKHEGRAEALLIAEYARRTR